MKSPIGVGILVLLCAALLIASSSAAQEFRTVPINPALQSSQQPGAPAQSQLPSMQPPRVTGQSSEQGIPGQFEQPSPVQPPAERPFEVPTERETPTERLSEFEEYISGKIAETVRVDIRQFGYDLFRLPPTTFAPVQNVPVGPDYVIGPGDELRITVWGKIEGAWVAEVDRDGNLNLPRIGILGVTGLTFAEVKNLIAKEFSRYYTGFEMNVSLGSLRTIRVYVVGNARKPGAYTISSISTLINALFETGGPAKTGTMRDIQVKRNGETVANFDLYDFLLRGDKSKDVRLMPEDVIFIPPVGPLAAVAGSVMSPAIYELRGETKVSELIDIAGGLSTVAFKGRLQIDRIVDKTRQTVFESSIDDIRENDMVVQSGDVVKVFQVVQDRRIVRVTGAVHRPGEYGFQSGMTVADLVSMAGGLRYYAYDPEAELTRVHVTEKGPVSEKISVQLRGALAREAESNLALKAEDYLFIRAIPEWDLYRMVTIKGEVAFPGTYTIKKGERISSLLERAGGLTDKAYPPGAVFTRERVREIQQRQIEEMVDRLERELLGLESANITTAASQDEAKLFQLEAMQKRQFVQKLRTVRAQGRVTINYTPTEKFKGSQYDIELEDGDSFFIPSNPNTVQVIGSVYNQNAFIYEKGEDYNHYVTMAGGFSTNADEDNIYVIKANGSAFKMADSSAGLTWNSERMRWEEGLAELASGDTVVVPEKLERIAWMRNIKDITQILFQVAVAAGVIIAAY